MQVNLSWGTVSKALFYRVYRGTTTGGPYQLIGQSNPNPGLTSASSGIVTTFQDGPGNLVNGVNYFYVVTAVTADGEGAYSSEFQATWPGAPPSVTGLTGVVV